MDTLQATYRDDEDGDTSEAHTPPPQTTGIQDGGTATAVNISGTKPELLEYNQVDEIKDSLQTVAAEDVSSGDIPLYATPEAMNTDQIGQPIATLQDGGTAGIPTITAVDMLLRNNQVDGIKEVFETAAAGDVSLGEKTFYGTPQLMDTDRIRRPTTEAQGEGTSRNPTTTAVDISGMKPEPLENNRVYEINEGLQTDAAGVVTSREIPLYGTLQEMAIHQSGGTSSYPTATTAVDILGKKPEQLENNQVDGIRELLQTAANGEASSGEISLYETPQAMDTDQMVQHDTIHSPDLPLETDGNDEEVPPLKKQRHLSDLPTPKLPEPVITEMPPPSDIVKPPAAAKAAKKSKKKNKDVWSTTFRKGKKKTKHASNSNPNSKDTTNGDASIEEKVLIAPIPRFPDKNDDSPDVKICLSKVYKAEKVELSDDRLSASSTKGYRMVRATRGVTDGAWYFEIKVVHLGETGHTRLGWSTEKAELQAPVGYDGSSFGYRDVDGSKVHKASREKYGDSKGYKEGDIVGFYISLPDGGAYAPIRQRLVWHKGQRYACAPDAKDEPKIVPGSEISYFKNGTCQGVAFTDLYGGCYYPAASMYTLPNQPACVVKFNFGPDFEMFPEDFGERPVPRSMSEVPYQSYDGKVDSGTPWNISRPCPMLKAIKEENSKILKASEMID